MQLIITRHTETNYNVAGLCNDLARNISLTDRGLQQASDLAQQLKDFKIDAVFVSDMERSKVTAGLINGFHGVPLIIDERLNDNMTGFQGKPVDEWRKHLNDSNDAWNFKAADGESLSEAYKRVKDFMMTSAVRTYDMPVIVTHDFTSKAIDACVREAEQFDVFANFIDQGSYRMITWQPR